MRFSFIFYEGGGVDYSGLPATVTFLSGDTNTQQRSADIIIINDNLLERREDIELVVTTTDGSSMISPDTATVFIDDNNGEPC